MRNVRNTSMNILCNALIIAALGLGASGCTSAFQMGTPGGFVELDDDDYDYRATNADGVVIGVRALDNDPHGDLSFWAGAVDARLRQRYTAESLHEVETEAGLEGIQIRYRSVQSGRDYLYWATVFVAGETVYFVEAGGDREIFDEELVGAAVRSLDAG